MNESLWNFHLVPPEHREPEAPVVFDMNNKVGRFERIQRRSENYDGFAFSFAEYASASLPSLIISQRRTMTITISSIVGIIPKPTTKRTGGTGTVLFTSTGTILIVACLQRDKMIEDDSSIPLIMNYTTSFTSEAGEVGCLPRS